VAQIIRLVPGLEAPSRPFAVTRAAVRLGALMSQSSHERQFRVSGAAGSSDFRGSVKKDRFRAVKPGQICEPLAVAPLSDEVAQYALREQA
jgi:hypothetical protein